MIFFFVCLFQATLALLSYPSLLQKVFVVVKDFTVVEKDFKVIQRKKKKRKKKKKYRYQGTVS